MPIGRMSWGGQREGHPRWEKEAVFELLLGVFSLVVLRVSVLWLLCLGVFQGSVVVFPSQPTTPFLQPRLWRHRPSLA